MVQITKKALAGKKITNVSYPKHITPTRNFPPRYELSNTCGLPLPPVYVAPKVQYVIVVYYVYA